MRKEKGFINLLLSLITIILLLVVIFFGYLVYVDYFGEATIVIGEAGYPIIENSNVSEREENEEPIGNIDISNTSQQDNTYSDNFFYSQLSDSAKLIYTELYKNKENLKTGTYTVQFGDAFKDILSQENGSDKLKEEYQSAIEAFTYENPDVFYLDPTKMYINIQTTKKLFNTTYEVFIDSGENANYLSKTYSSKEQILEYENQINKEVVNILSETEGKSDYQKILIIHDYLVDNVTYDETVSKNNIYNMYGALVNKEAVCEGYAKAFQYLMQQIGIESVIIIGSATDSDENIQNHAWNYVKLNNTWYAVDVTWDDPVLIGGGILTKRYRYKYFLKGSETMSKDHVESYTFVDDGKVYTLPTLSVTDY